MGSKLYSLAWRPDGQEIAFASTHGFPYSQFQADIFFTVRVRDGRLHRLSNPPGQQEIQGKGAVTGRISNNFGPVTTLPGTCRGRPAPG